MFVLRNIKISAINTIRNNVRTFINIINEPGEVRSSYNIPDSIIKPPHFYTLNEPSSLIGNITIHDEEQIRRMKKSCRIAANILNKCHEIVQVRSSNHELLLIIF